MMNRSKLDYAKIKLTKLKEKYSIAEISPNTNKPLIELSSLSGSEGTDKGNSHHTHVLSDALELPGSSQFMLTKKSNESETPLSKQEAASPSLLTKASLSFVDNQIFPNSGATRSKPEYISEFKSSLQSPGFLSLVSNSKSSISDTFEQSKVSQPGSTILSELSNKFENIHFLSSSSDDLSLNQASLISKRSIKKMVETNLTSPPVTSRLKTADSVFNKISHQTFKDKSANTLSSTNSKVSSPSSVQSVEEIDQLRLDQASLPNYKSDFESDTYLSPKYSSSLADKNIFEQTHLKNSSMFKNVPAISLDKELRKEPKGIIETPKVELTVLEDMESSFVLKANRPKQKREKPKLNQITKEVRTEEKSQTPKGLTKNETPCSKQSGGKSKKPNLTLTSHEKTTQTDFQFQFYSTSRCHKRLTLKRPNKNIPRQISINPSKRPVLKSCVLVQNTETNQVEGLKNQIGNCVFGESAFSCNNYESGDNLDDLKTQMLTNQIQLTRHFIESHHQMYLHCCQAAKTLSQEYNHKA